MPTTRMVFGTWLKATTYLTPSRKRSLASEPSCLKYPGTKPASIQVPGTLSITICPSLHLQIKKSAETTHSIYSLNIDELRKEVVVPLKKDHDEPCLAFSAEPALGLSVSGLWLSSCAGDGEGTSTLTLKTWIVPLSLETASHLDSGENAML